MNQLEQLKSMTKVVADTGDIELIKIYKPEDATTNPSLIYKASQLPLYSSLVEKSIEFAKKNGGDVVRSACDWLSVAIGKEIQLIIPGFVSTEVDVRFSFNTKKTVEKARKLFEDYQKMQADNNRLLIKIAATWEGIKAAEILEREGIRCNLTLLFSLSQAKACADAGVYLISPFVGRILDWYQKNTNKQYDSLNDPGVASVVSIFNYYKKHQYQTILMGASFRNINQIRELAGCDCLTISSDLLKELQASNEPLAQRLFDNNIDSWDLQEIVNESTFRWSLNENTMATEKLAEGIRNFAVDQNRLEQFIAARIK